MSKREGVIKSLSRSLPYLIEYKFKLTIILVGTIMFALMRLVDPYLYKKLVDEVLIIAISNPGIALKKAALICGIIVALRLGTSFIFAFYSYFSLQIVSLVEAKMFRHSLAQLQSLDMSFHDSKNSGEILSRVDRGIESLNRILHENIAKFFLPGIINIACLVVWMAMENWILTIASVIFLPLHVYASLKKANPVYLNQSKINRIYERVYHRAYEGIYNIAAVISFNASDYELAKFDKDSKSALALKLSSAKLWRVLNFSASFFEVLGRISVIMLGTYLISTNGSSIGQLVMFLAYLSMIYQPMLDMITTYLMMQQELAKARRFTDLMEIKTKIVQPENPKNISKISHGISINNVSFKYEEFIIPDSIEEKDDDGNIRSYISSPKIDHVLEDVNLFIPAGSKIALVGPTGSGKSTLANLIHRYYDPTNGSVELDGIDIRHIDINCIHSLITVVPQQALLFSRTIKENIAYGKDDPTNDEIIEAAKIANAHDFILEKPKGYETKIGERGIRLSGGEQQRISIARAIMRNASVIIMDEATSHLDSLSESVVQEAMWKMMEGKTAIIIAHRLSTILNADMIIVINKGRIVDSGTHSALLKRCELYKKLYSKQFEIPDQEDFVIEIEAEI